MHDAIADVAYVEQPLTLRWELDRNRHVLAWHPLHIEHTIHV
jgi:hypothetical protein